jgi:hypothetical protein
MNWPETPKGAESFSGGIRKSEVEDLRDAALDLPQEARV